MFIFRRFYRLFLRENSVADTLETLYDLMRDSFVIPYLQKRGRTDLRYLEMTYTCYKAGLVAVIEKWFRDGLQDTPDEVATILFNTLRL